MKITLSVAISVLLMSSSFASNVFKCTDKKAYVSNIVTTTVSSNELVCRCPAKSTKEDYSKVTKVAKKKDCKSPCYLGDNNNSTDRCQLASDLISEKWRGYSCPQQCSELSFESSSEPTLDERKAGKKQKADCQIIKEAICKPNLTEENEESSTH